MTEAPTTCFVRVESLLRQMLRGRGLERPDRRPLYAYKVTDDELNKLALSLSKIFETRNTLGIEESAGLVLLAAGRFCARHETGHWRWETALAEVLPTSWRPDGRFYEHLLRGLAWWRRDVVVSRGTREFLVTLACEGGLPLALVSREGTRLRAYFGRLLRTREEFPTLDLQDSARSLSYLLPTTLVNESLLTFAALLIDAVADLRQQVRGEKDPIEALKRNTPEWEHRIPLRLDEEDARELLNGLLRAPSPESSTSLDEVFLRLQLDTTAGLRVRREPIFPSLLSLEALARLIGCDPNELPTRLLLSMEASDGVRRPFARCTRVHGGASYRLERTGERPRLIGSVMVGRIDLVASTAGGFTWRALFPSGEELADLPWVFVDPGDERTSARMLGSGSVSVRAPAVLVAAPSEVQPQGGESTRLGELQETLRAVWRVRGEVHFDREGDVAVVRTAQNCDDEARYVLCGRSTSLAPGLDSYWLGTPRIFEQTDDGRRRLLKGVGVQWRSAEAVSRQWTLLDERTRGRGELRYVEKGETLFKTKATLLGADFTCRVTPGPGNGEGTLAMQGGEVTSVAPQAVPGCTFHVKSSGVGGHAIHCRQEKDASRPTSIRVALVLRDGATAVVEAPFPAPQVGFIGARGRLLPNRQPLALEAIASVRASVQTPRSDGYLLEARSSTGSFQLADLPRMADGRFELPLDVVFPRVEQLLAADDDLDSEVELRIVRRGLETPGGDARLRVRRFDRRLITLGGSAGETSIRIEPQMDNLDYDAEANLQVVATPMWAPASEPEALARDPENSAWRFPPPRASGGPWLVTALESGRLIARPTCFVAADDSPATGNLLPSGSGRVSLSDAVRMHGEALLDALAVVIQRVGGDPEDDDWTLLGEYLETLDSLPANTYEAIKALVKEPDAVALAALHALPRPYFRVMWEKLERLPFLWALVPIDSWMRSASRLLTAHRKVWEQLPHEFRNSQDPTAGVRGLVARMREHADRRSPFLECTADALAFRLFADVPKSGLLGATVRDPSGRALQQVLEEAHNRLRLRNEDRTWPQEKLGTLLDRAGIARSDPTIPWVKPRKADTNAVLNAPVVAAALSVLVVREVVVDRETVVALQALRSFDSEWFDEAHAIATALLLAKWLQRRTDD